MIKIEFTQDQLDEILRYMDEQHCETIQDAIILAIRCAKNANAFG